MSLSYDVSNTPNAGRLIESLRYLGYGNYEALADIIDNSIDAGAHHISIRIASRQGEIEITIADDGCGMDRETLDQAMRLGSLTERSIEADLGKFGMGLVTASLSMARHCHVITRSARGELWSSAWDVDHIVRTNTFSKHLDRATTAERKLFRELLPKAKSGTIIRLTKVDNLSNRNTTVFAATLSEHLGRVHRYFIKEGVQININDKPVNVIDPLQLDDKGTQIVVDDTISFRLDGQEHPIRIRVVLLPDEPLHALDVAKSMKAQGFYVLRNKREIANAVTLGFFTKHPDFNRMRGEIFFTGALDRQMGIEFTKRQVNLSEELSEELGKILIPTCRTIKRGESTRRIEADTAAKEQHTRAAKAIAEKSKVLLRPQPAPPTEAEEREKERQREKSGAGSEAQPAAKSQKATLREREAAIAGAEKQQTTIEFREEHLGPTGQLYEADLQGRKVVVRYNIEHPAYARLVSENLDSPRLVSAIDFLLYSMAAAELRVGAESETANETLANFKGVMSANLRTLLS